MQMLLQILLAIACFGVFDFIWLGLVAKKFYYNHIGDLLRKKPRLIPAVIFYTIYCTAIVLLVIRPAFDAASIWQALGRGALFGLAAYATYDLTNLATLKGFKTKVALADMTWGTFATAIVSSIVYAVFA